ncbi:hypothetical protein FHS43_006028 [Streptosporangium becharense]|uniref:Secreted protein n=1 Tax=Streptosporangium becharense TaxID=1816182 RepID=A0A7W9IIR3_9ACTN|nr:hypothetical protein [Streptosporangium becharense]MBB2914716.1 hypothetical protein [Streptosporangium becharense]MBB5820883.1 hypothetical protein [Streptosporangium becharense]
MNRKMAATALGVGLTAGLLGLGATGASAAETAAPAGETAGVAAPKPPKGARAVVRVSPNPTAKRGEEVTITGHCGGGKGLKNVVGGFGNVTLLENVKIVKDDPKGFVAKATLSEKIGNGVGPVFVDCGGEAGVTLLVTNVTGSPGKTGPGN